MTARRTYRSRRGRPARRLQVSLLLLALVVTAFALRLVQLQGLDAPAYASAAAKQRARTIVLAAERGSILDTNGQPLAMSVDGRAVYADPRQVVDPASEATALAPVLRLDASELQTRLARTSAFVYLARGVTPQVGAAVTALNLPGIGLLPEPRRVYPNGGLASNVIGFVGLDGQGLSGLEYADQQLLAGRPGEMTEQIGRDGRAIPAAQHTERAAVAGGDVLLTLDRDIQWEAQQAIAAQVTRTGAQSGTVVVMDPRSGQVLALATAPGFNPARIAGVKAADLGDRPISDVYEPGSTNKVITFAAGLQTRVITPMTPVTVPPTLHLAGHTFHDAEKHGTEHLTAAGVLAKSSNLGTILVSQRVGADRLSNIMHSFGLGTPTDIGLPGESSGILPPANQWSGTQRYTIPFGQGVSVTAVQVASVYATVANDGVRVPPRIVKGTVDPTGQFRAALAPRPHRVISPGVAKQLRTMLEAVTTNDGTAPAARIPGYRVAGKTGTSQRVDPTCGCYRGYTASFVGFAPADKPQLLVEVVLQAPRRGHFGGLIAAPVFHDVMSFALQSRHVAPTGTKSPKLRLTFS
ncbi:MAG: peptidoglycan D,D-transpeptidase FtsI family protein [Actinomycetes bacterium]